MKCLALTTVLAFIAFIDCLKFALNDYKHLRKLSITSHVLSSTKAETATNNDDVPQTKSTPYSRVTPLPDKYASNPPYKKKAYGPKSNDLKKSTQTPYWGKVGDSTSSGSGSDTASSVLLRNPQLLIRYKMPPVKSQLKLRLETFQETYKEQADKYYDRPQSSQPRTGGVGAQSSTDASKKPRSFDSFPSSSSDADRKKTSRGKTGSYDDRKGSTGKPKKSVDDGDDDSDDYTYEDGLNQYELDNEDAFVSLSSLSGDVLREMEAEGFSLDEMQLAIFGEYGIKATIQAIKRRLMDDKMDRKFRKYSGKTRREKAKARSVGYKRELASSNDVILPATGNIQVQDLAKLIGVGGGDVVKHLMMNAGVMATMTQSIDIEVAKTVVVAFGKVVKESGAEEVDEEDDDDEDDDDDVQRVHRSPVVTIMGHVDHGKTTLLDRIRKLSMTGKAGDDEGKISTNFVPVAPTEAGGITQSISAFKVKTYNDRYVTFFDTPGHAAFSEMRKRGANVTDIVVLVVAADDGIMDQTKECIYAAKAAGCPIVVAINKIDKEGADAQAILTDLMSYDVLPEEFGGDVQVAKLSAKRAIGIEALLEKILLQAELMELTADPTAKPEGTIIESRVDKRLGTIATILVQKGTLKVGDIILAGSGWGKVRKMTSDQGIELKEAGPSTPIQVLGFNTIPSAGDEFIVVDDESAAREVAEARMRIARQQTASSSMASMISQATILSSGGSDNREILKVPLVLKADVSGSVEALKASLENIKESDATATCLVDLVQAGIGEVTASDVAVAAVSKAKIVAFNVAAKPSVTDLARSSNVEIGYYNVVYDLLDEVTAKVRNTLSPPPPGVLVGRAEIKKAFRVGKVGKVAGCVVTEGTVKSGSKIRIMRGSRNPVYTGELVTLQFGKDKVDEVVEGSECGMSFSEFQDFEEGDIVECFSPTGADAESN